MLRHARQMAGDPLTFLARTAAELGDVVAFPMPGRPTYFVNDPLAVQRVLRDNHRAYGKRTLQYDTLALVTGHGLLTADLDPWREHRRIVQPAFHHDALQPLVESVVRATDRLLERWDRAPTGSLVDVESAMAGVALEVVSEGLFSGGLDGSGQALVAAVLQALDEVLARAQNPLAPALAVPTPGNLRLRRAVARIDEAVSQMTAARTRADPHADLLGLLLESGLTEREVRDEVVTAIVAGHETVASALTWAWYLLGRYPGQRDRLRAEVDAVLGAGGNVPGWADVPRLTGCRQVVDETLRLYPPAWVITRRALVDDELAGVRLPAGALVIIGIHALHHRDDVWPDPERFIPSRFEALTAAQRQSYLPFGSGPRLCIGRDFALLEATVVLARISQRYVLRPASASPVQPAARVTIRPRGGLLMAVERS